MTKTVRIIRDDGLIGICRQGEAATHIITDVPDYVDAVDVLSELAVYKAGRIPTGVMTYRKLLQSRGL